MRIQSLTCRLISANCYLTGSNDAASTQTVTYNIILKRTDNNLFWENYLWHWGIPLLMCFRLTSTRQSTRPLCDFRPFKGMPTIGSRWFSGILPNTVLDITSVDVWTHFHPEKWQKLGTDYARRSEHSKMKSKMEINRLGTNNRTQFSSWVPESLAGRENPKFLKISSPSKLPMLKKNTRVKIISTVRLEVTSSLKLFPYLIGSLLQLTVKILAILWLTITFFPLWWNFNFTVNFFTTNGYNLQIFTRNGLICWPFYG